MSVTTVTTCHCNVGEGPFWDAASQSLMYVDIPENNVHRWDSQTQKEEVVKLDDLVSFVIRCRTGGYAVGSHHKLARLDWETRSLQTLAEIEEGPTHKFNDAKCDSSGRLFAGTVAMDVSPEAGSLYSVDGDMTVTRRLDKITCSNGIEWNGDSSIMYYIDSLAYRVDAFDYDISTGDIRNRRAVLEFPHHDIGGQGIPDGMTIDLDDKLWVACFSGGKVIRVDPEKGVIMQEVKLPASNITSCTFGGKNLDELYVTSATMRVDGQAIQEPPAGSVFRVTGLGVKGRLPNFFDI